MDTALFTREYRNQMYGVTAFYMSKSAIELPVGLIYPTITTVIPFYACGMNDVNGNKIWNALLVSNLTFIASCAWGLMCGTIVKNIQ